MIENTFIHIQGIGPRTEQRLWARGIHSWQGFLSNCGTIFNPGRDAFIRQELAASFEHRSNVRFFSDRLPATEHWRIFDAFRDRAVYLDIETSGGFHGMDEITVIGIYDGTKVRTFVNGKNLEDFEIAIADYEMVITFNGSCFDLPFIRRWFPNITLPPAHIDLRFFLKRLGFRGGLKTIEKDFGLGRGEEIDGMDGFEAIRLWQAYLGGDKQALELLIRYNTADIVNLEPLMVAGYERMKRLLMTRMRCVDSSMSC